MTDNILVGTASWTDKTLLECGRFYPPEANTPEARLRFYASQFPMAEIDSSYYGIPAPQVAQGWAERTPEGFVFNVKAFRLFTGHQALVTALDRDLQKALGPGLPRTLYYEKLPAETSGDPLSRTPADNQTVRNVFIIGPDKKIKLVLVYPMTTGRNFAEILRVIDSLQMTAKHRVATPADWNQGDDVIIAGSVSDDEAKTIYPAVWKAPKPYIRIVPQPK